MIPGVVKMPMPMTLEMTSAAASTGPRTRLRLLCCGGAAADTAHTILVAVPLSDLQTMNLRSLAARIAILLLAALALAATAPRAEFVPWEEAAPILAAAGDTLPQDLAGKKPQQLMEMWPDWVRAQDKDVRERLAKGDEDSLVNLLLFGTSFTREPRVAAEFFEKLRALGDPQQAQAELQRVIVGRGRDLVLAMAAPQRNERVDFMRRLVMAKGMSFATPQDKQKV